LIDFSVNCEFLLHYISLYGVVSVISLNFSLCPKFMKHIILYRYDSCCLELYNRTRTTELQN